MIWSSFRYFLFAFCILFETFVFRFVMGCGGIHRIPAVHKSLPCSDCVSVGCCNLSFGRAVTRIARKGCILSLLLAHLPPLLHLCPQQSPNERRRHLGPFCTSNGVDKAGKDKGRGSVAGTPSHQPHSASHLVFCFFFFSWAFPVPRKENPGAPRGRPPWHPLKDTQKK